jgi:hypothetical protein
MNTIKVLPKQNKKGTKKSKTAQILSGEKSFDLTEAVSPTFPNFQKMGQDQEGNEVQCFDFVLTEDNTNKKSDFKFVEQADCNCSSWPYGGKVINTPLSTAWKNLEETLLKTIKNHKAKIRISHADFDMVINPDGGKKLDCDQNDNAKLYPTFEITNKKTKDTVFYEYFQLSAQDRALIALDLIEESK